MAYTPPIRSAIDATLADGYAPPERTSVDAVLGGSGATVRARTLMLHDWAIRSFARQLVDHPAAWRLRASVGHAYSGRSVPRALVLHWYGPASSPRGSVAHHWSHRVESRVTLGHLYAVISPARTLASHPFAMIAATARSLSAHAWAVEAVARARTASTHLWWLQGEGAVATLGGVSVAVAGRAVDGWAGVELTWSREQFAISARLDLADPVAWAACRPGDQVTVTLAGW